MPNISLVAVSKMREDELLLEPEAVVYGSSQRPNNSRKGYSGSQRDQHMHVKRPFLDDDRRNNFRNSPRKSRDNEKSNQRNYAWDRKSEKLQEIRSRNRGNDNIPSNSKHHYSEWSDESDSERACCAPSKKGDLCFHWKSILGISLAVAIMSVASTWGVSYLINRKKIDLYEELEAVLGGEQPEYTKLLGIYSPPSQDMLESTFWRRIYAEALALSIKPFQVFKPTVQLPLLLTGPGVSPNVPVEVHDIRTVGSDNLGSGLYNEGNTCYLASAIQLLRQSKYIRELILEQDLSATKFYGNIPHMLNYMRSRGWFHRPHADRDMQEFLEKRSEREAFIRQAKPMTTLLHYMFTLMESKNNEALKRTFVVGTPPNPTTPLTIALTATESVDDIPFDSSFITNAMGTRELQNREAAGGLSRFMHGLFALLGKYDPGKQHDAGEVFIDIITTLEKEGTLLTENPVHHVGLHMDKTIEHDGEAVVQGILPTDGTFPRNIFLVLPRANDDFTYDRRFIPTPEVIFFNLEIPPLTAIGTRVEEAGYLKGEGYREVPYIDRGPHYPPQGPPPSAAPNGNNDEAWWEWRRQAAAFGAVAWFHENKILRNQLEADRSHHYHEETSKQRSETDLKAEMEKLHAKKYVQKGYAERHGHGITRGHWVAFGMNQRHIRNQEMVQFDDNSIFRVAKDRRMQTMQSLVFYQRVQMTVADVWYRARHIIDLERRDWEARIDHTQVTEEGSKAKAKPIAGDEKAAEKDSPRNRNSFKTSKGRKETQSEKETETVEAEVTKGTPTGRKGVEKRAAKKDIAEKGSEAAGAESVKAERSACEGFTQGYDIEHDPEIASLQASYPDRVEYLEKRTREQWERWLGYEGGKTYFQSESSHPATEDSPLLSPRVSSGSTDDAVNDTV